MAEASKSVRVVTTRVESVTLTLSIQEAEFLAAVFQHIGGSDRESPRKHANAITKALRASGVPAFAGQLSDPFAFVRVGSEPERRHAAALFDERHVGSGIRFKDYPRDWSADERG